LNVALTRMALGGAASRPTPAVDLDFVAGRYAVAGQGEVALDAITAFTRDSIAFRRAASGLILPVDADVPRFDHAPDLSPIGLLLDPATPILADETTTTPTRVDVTTVTGPDGGAASGLRLEPTAVSGTHSFGRSSVSFVSGRSYAFTCIAKAAGYRWMRMSFPAEAFPTNNRIAVFDAQDGALGTVQAGVAAEATQLGDGWTEFYFAAAASSSGTGFVGLTFGTSNTTGQQTFTGDGGAILYAFERLEESLFPTSYAPLVSPRAAEELRVLVAPGNYDVLIEDATGRQAWLFDRVAETNDEASGLLFEGAAIPAGITRIARLRAWEVQRTSLGYRSTVAADVLPTPLVALDATQGVTLVDGRVSAWASVEGAAGAAAQDTADARPGVVEVNGVPLLSVASGQWMSVSGVTRARNNLSIAVAFRSDGTSAQALVGSNNTVNGANVRTNVSSPRSVALGITGFTNARSAPAEDTGGLICAILTRRGDRTFIDVDGGIERELNASTVPVEMTDPATKELFRRTSAGAEQFTGLFAEYREYAALSEPQRRRLMRDMQARWGAVEVSTVSKMWAGAATLDGFTVAADVTGAARVRLRVSTETDFSVNSFTGDWITPTPTPGPGTTIYKPVKASCAGLAAGTLYHYALEIEGTTLDTNRRGQVRTAPTAGSAWRMAILSCSRITPTTTAQGLQVVAGLQPDFVLHIGDMHYSDRTNADVRDARSKNTRYYRQNPDAAALLALASHAYVPDDHDSAGNDCHRGSVYSGGVTGAEVFATTIQAYLETTPHYPLADSEARCLAQAFDWGDTRVIMLDTRMQQRRATANGLATCLGDPNLGDFDQNAWVRAELLAAAGKRNVFLVSPSGVGFAGGASWGDVAAQELDALVRFIRDEPTIPQVWWITGDYHRCALDDGARMSRGDANGGTTTPAGHLLPDPRHQRQPALPIQHHLGRRGFGRHRAHAAVLHHRLRGERGEKRQLLRKFQRVGAVTAIHSVGDGGHACDLCAYPRPARCNAAAGQEFLRPGWRLFGRLVLWRRQRNRDMGAEPAQRRHPGSSDGGHL
jgi:hypothetical protein